MRKMCHVEFVKHVGLHPMRCQKCGAGSVAGAYCKRSECGGAGDDAGALEAVCVWKVTLTVDDGTGQAVLQLLGRPAEDVLR